MEDLTSRPDRLDTRPVHVYSTLRSGDAQHTTLGARRDKLSDPEIPDASASVQLLYKSKECTLGNDIW